MESINASAERNFSFLFFPYTPDTKKFFDAVETFFHCTSTFLSPSSSRAWLIQMTFKSAFALIPRDERVLRNEMYYMWLWKCVETRQYQRSFFITPFYLIDLISQLMGKRYNFFAICYASQSARQSVAVSSHQPQKLLFFSFYSQMAYNSSLQRCCIWYQLRDQCGQQKKWKARGNNFFSSRHRQRTLIHRESIEHGQMYQIDRTRYDTKRKKMSKKPTMEMKNYLFS